MDRSEEIRQRIRELESMNPQNEKEFDKIEHEISSLLVQLSQIDEK